MSNNVAPDSWETQADSSPVEQDGDSNELSAKFSTLNVYAAEFVPSISFNSPSGDGDDSHKKSDNSESPDAKVSLHNGKYSGNLYLAILLGLMTFPDVKKSFV